MSFVKDIVLGAYTYVAVLLSEGARLKVKLSADKEENQYSGGGGRGGFRIRSNLKPSWIGFFRIRNR
jgi:hypothetical protein